jgi:HlyD family secretion protein
VVAVDNRDLKLKPGMTANASIITARKKDILTVSNQALRFVPPPDAKIKNAEQPQENQPRSNAGGSGRAGGNGQNQRLSYKGQGVWTENKDGSLTRIEIQTGITDGVKTEISETVNGELNENTPIIASVESAGAAQKNNQMRMPRF